MGIEKMIAIALGVLVLIVGMFIVFDWKEIINGGEGKIDDALCKIQSAVCVEESGCTDGTVLGDITCGEGYVCCKEKA